MHPNQLPLIPLAHYAPMFCFLFHATMDPDRPHDESTRDVGGAYASCWIHFPEQAGAEVLARYYLKEAGWIPDELESVRVQEREDHDGEESQRHFDQALRFGVCITLDLYPAEE